MSTFPQKWTSTVSHWQATNRGQGSLWDHNRSTPLPSHADLVIIGGGMCGAALSYFITRPGAWGEGKKVVCLDAKDCGSGASGRNGGHVGPQTFVQWHKYQQPYPRGLGVSPEEAVHVMQNERDNLDLIESVIKKEGIDVDFWRGELCQTHHSKEETMRKKKLYEEWMAAREKMGLQANPDTRFIDDPQEAEELSRFKGVDSVHIRPGGSVHSHRLCSALMKLAIDSTSSDFDFYSWAPVSGFPELNADGKRVVKTSRGNVIADKVILATNAHTPNFFPKSSPLHDHIQPVRIQCSLITPPPSYSGDSALKTTYNMRDGHYLVQTPMGGLVLGGGRERLGDVDDSIVDPEVTAHLAGFMKGNFTNWGPEAYGEGLTRTWTGIITTVKDLLPLVGEVPGEEGVGISAGYGGHGMSRIFCVARAYESLLRTGQWNEALLPISFKLTPERVERADKAHEAFVKEYGKLEVINGKVTPGQGGGMMSWAWGKKAFPVLPEDE